MQFPFSIFPLIFCSKLNDILDILKFHQKNKIEGKGLWLSLNEEYNIESLIHSNKSKIFGFTDPVLSLIDSFNFPNKESIYEIDKINILQASYLQ